MNYYKTREECETAIFQMTRRGESRIFQITNDVLNNSDPLTQMLITFSK